jgi:hypothetical protein
VKKIIPFTGLPAPPDKNIQQGIQKSNSFPYNIQEIILEAADHVQPLMTKKALHVPKE